MGGWESRERPFNMAMLFYGSLNQIWEESDRAYINSDLIKWYLCLKALYKRISFKLSKEELKGISEKFENSFVNSPNILIKTQSNKKELMVSEFAKELENIEVELIRIMNKNKMIFPNIQYSQGLDKISKRYKLE